MKNLISIVAVSSFVFGASAMAAAPLVCPEAISCTLVPNGAGAYQCADYTSPSFPGWKTRSTIASNGPVTLNFRGVTIGEQGTTDMECAYALAPGGRTIFAFFPPQGQTYAPMTSIKNQWHGKGIPNACGFTDSKNCPFRETF